jgi:outer membrane receptor protein involved in Fe transport
MNLSASSSNYSYLGKNINIDSMIYWNRGNLITRENTYRLLTRSGINENTTSFHGEYFQGDKHSIMFGGNVKWYGISPKVENIGVLHDTTILSRKTDHVILSGYLQDQIKINNAFKLIPGLNVNKMTHFSKKIYFDKRLEIIYQPLEDITTSVSYSETTQYLHLLSLSKISLASDMWLMANDDIEPARAKDISLSIGLVPHTGWNISTSLYYREYEDLLMYKEGASYREKVGSFDELITSGTGMGRGMELLIEKSTGGAKGFISYSLSSAYRKFPGVNNGEKFKSRYNRPHILYIVSTVDLAPKWKFGFVFNLMSGAMETYSHSRYISWFDIGEPLQDNVYHESMSGFDILVYQRNAYRLPLYHRLDLSLSYEFASRFGSHTLNLGLYNAYNAKNPYSMNQVYIFEGYMGNPPVENSYFQINEKVLFPIIPFINYRFKISEL